MQGEAVETIVVLSEGGCAFPLMLQVTRLQTSLGLANLGWSQARWERGKNRREMLDPVVWEMGTRMKDFATADPLCHSL